MQFNTALCFLNIAVSARCFKDFCLSFLLRINRFVSKLILKTVTSVMEFRQHVLPAT